MATVNKTGAIIENTYHSLNEEVCPVPKSAILENSSSALEEIWQFSVGGFLFSGAFWLGLERLLTVGKDDALFLACIAFVICGGVLAVSGYRQAQRRVSRLEKYIPNDDS
ncbi:hypothetical protein OCA8868_00452 [Octadecabacter ascidiaceicola]|uniref:YrhK domain-containing protein n=1 Tax=Octadecabacter ascidiaceicola TaxID=1655543 RepID=A0A238JLR5_9RHOB|nr:hypothetical protein OCA8868_00452 [Octadecabacter ascidiaceicola]